MTEQRAKTSKSFSNVVLLIGGFLVLGAFYGGRVLGRRVKGSVAKSSQTQIEAPEAGNRLLLVYVGSSKCGSCRSPDIPRFVSTARDSLLARGHRDSTGVTSIGIASELDPRSGISHLAAVAAFDEVAAGQGIMNQANRHFVSIDHPGMQATPQLIVLIRNGKRSPSGGLDDATVTEQVLVRKVGLQQIDDWVKLGVPLPKYDVSSLHKQ